MNDGRVYECTVHDTLEISIGECEPRSLSSVDSYTGLTYLT